MKYSKLAVSLALLTNILSALPSRIRANEMIAGMPAATGGVPLAAHTVTFTTLYVDGFQSANGPVKVLTTDASGLATIQVPPPVGGLAIAVTATAVGVTKTASFGVKIGANTSSTPTVVINACLPRAATLITVSSPLGNA